MKKSIIYLSLTAMTIILCLTGCGSSGSSDGTSTQEKYDTQILATGADFSSTGSVKFNPDGEMLVVDAIANKIIKMNPETGQVLGSLPDEGFGGPGDVAFGPDQAMYWSNPPSREVWKRTPDGVTTLIGTVPNTIDGIAVNSEGRVFTASADGSKQLWELDSYGLIQPRVVAEMGGLDAYDFGPDGYLYGPDFYNGTGNLYKINVDNGEVQTLASGFCQPIAAQVSPEGEVYVLDYGCPYMYKVDTLTGEKTVVADIPAGSDNFDFYKGEIYVANVTGTFIYKIDKDGGIENITKPGFAIPGGISVRTDDSGTETIYVGHGWSMRRFDSNGEVRETFDLGSGIIPPFSMYDDGETLIMTCWYLNLVQAYDPVTKSVAKTYDGFTLPLNAIRFQGEIIVAELETGTVARASDHTLLIEGLTTPLGLAATDKDLWVGDRETGIIWKAVENGKRLDPPTVVAKGLSKPEGMTTDHDGRLLVMEVGAKRLVRIDPSAGEIFVLAEDLAVNLEVPGAPSTWMAVSSVVVSAAGDIYATGDQGNHIYKITRRKT